MSAGSAMWSSTLIRIRSSGCMPAAFRRPSGLYTVCELSVSPTPGLSIMLTTFAASEPGGWQRMLDRARAADEAGVDRLFVSDHVAFGEHLEAYARPELGGWEGGRQPTGPDGHWLEPLTVLSVVAGVTSRVRLATGILLAALRRPA